VEYSLLSGRAIAEGLGGFLEFNYSNAAIKTEDETGETTKTKSDNFSQLYNLSFRRTIFPTIFLNAGGIFEKSMTKNSVDGEGTKFSTTDIKPFVDITLKNPVYTLGGKYDRREQKQTGSDLLTVTNVNENYMLIFGWKPEAFPSFDMRLGRSKLFDKERASQDTVTDFLLLSLQYVPEYGYLKGLDIRYQPAYRKIQEKIDDVITTDQTHNARVTYSDNFFSRRVSLYTSYNIAHTKTETILSSTTSEVSSQLFPFSGLSTASDSLTNVVLNLNSALIDGNTLQSAGVDIGLAPVGGDTRARNAGTDFVAETEVNSISIWVDRELPDQIANAFSWEIYTSQDNENWAFLTTVPLAAFGPFQNRFEINFPNVTTRYIKVVTRPLTPGDTLGVPGDFSSIFVTEMQAFLRKPAGELDKRTKDTRTNNIYNLDVRTRVFDVPTLYYEFSYYLAHVASSFTNSTLSNGLSATHRFSSIVTAQARVAREDIVLKDDTGYSYLYNASMTAHPLKTLSHTLNYSGQTKDIGGEKSNTNSVFINNTAELYKGINIKIDGGISFNRRDTGEKTTNTLYSFGSGIVPHRRLSLDLYYTGTRTKQSGGDQGDSTDFTRRGTMGVSYKPFDTLYLIISLESITDPDKTRNLQNYGINWSPFPDGSLQFTFSYNESLTSDEGKTRQINPSLRWNISARTHLDLSSQFLKSESESLKSESVISSATFRTVF